jgi:ferredoxin--NADP+ reductase/benzoate/toluate 1,2-dioxygenase reductase subunit
VGKDETIAGKSPSTGLHKILQVRLLTESTFVLRMARGGMQFKPGQHIIVGIEGELDQREYSIYSGVNDDYLEILVKEVLDGKVSLQLRQCKPGQLLQVNGPFGSFGIEKFDMYSRKFVFIASGTGISPFHSFVRSYPGIDYIIFHGVRYNVEAYEKDEYESARYVLCTSKEVKGTRKGRVTQFISDYPLSPVMLFYLCGNNNMIFDVFNILKNRSVPEENIFSERYF